MNDNYRNSSIIILTFIVIVAVFVRLYGIGHGMFDTYFHDGINFVENALRMGSSNFTYYGYGHGVFFSIILFIAFGFMFLFQLLLGTIHSKEDFFFQYVDSPATFHLIAKLTVIFFGILSILLTYFIAKKLFKNKNIALLSTLFVAFTFPNIQMSFLVKADNLALFFLLLSSYFAVNILTSNKKPLTLWYVWSGFCIGLASAAKYTFIFGAFIIFAAHLVKAIEKPIKTVNLIKSFFNKNIFYSMLSVLLGFFCGNPFILKDWKSFLNGVFVLKRAYSPAMYTNNLADQVFFYRYFLGLPIFLLIIFSFVFLLTKDVKKAVFLLIFPISLIIFFSLCAIELHHLLPTIPFFGICISYLCWNILKPIKKEVLFKFCLIILGILIVWPSFLSSLRFKKVMASPDTRNLAKKWTEENIDAGSVVLAEGAAQDILVLSPQLNANVEALKREKENIISKGGRGRLYEMRIKWTNQHPEVRTFSLFKVKVINEGLLKEIKPEVVILTGAYDVEGRSWLKPSLKVEREKARITLNSNYNLIKTFNAHPKFSFLFPFVTKEDFLKLNKITLFTDMTKLYSGCDIYVYRKKQKGENAF